MKATYKGRYLGWFETREDAEAAIEAARREDEREQAEWESLAPYRG